MKVKFVQTDRPPQIDENIVVNGQVVGWVKEYTNCLDAKRFHCGLHIQINKPSDELFPALVQGHGESKESAIEDAITRGSAYAESLLAGITVLASELRG